MSVTAASLVVTLLSASLMMFTGLSSFSGSLQSPNIEDSGDSKEIGIWDRDNVGNKHMIQVDLIQDPSSHLRSSNLKESASFKTCLWFSCPSYAFYGQPMCRYAGEGFVLVYYEKTGDPRWGTTRYECCKV